MKVAFFTLVLDGMPHIMRMYPELAKLNCDWRWIVPEGVAKPHNCTFWCADMEGRLSNDGTTDYLRTLNTNDRRVMHWTRNAWPGKVSMCNAALQLNSFRNEKFLLWQIDSDEFWTADQINTCIHMFEDHPERDCAYFWCRYFVGPDIVITSRDTYGNVSSYEWLRVWRCGPGQQFIKHEPPRLSGSQKNPFRHAETEAFGLVFDHYAYATERQLEFKEAYYGSPANQCGHLYKNAVAGWKRLQENQNWPVRQLKEFMPWVGDNVVAERIST